MEIKATRIFIRCVKPLAKRYRSFRNDYAKFLDELEENPQMGVDLGMDFAKSVWLSLPKAKVNLEEQE